MRKSATSLVLLLGLTGCSLIPDYNRPALPISASWPNGQAIPPRGSSNPGDVPAAGIGWRDFFSDPIAQQLITLGLANNRDLRVSVLNVAQAQAQYRSDRASLLPTVDATAGYDASRTPGDVLGTTGPQNLREYSLGMSAVSWELDLFGRIRSQAEQSRQTFLSDAETQRSAQISLIAQIGSAWLTWLADRDALTVAQNTVAAQTNSLRLTKLLSTNGSGTAQQVAQAETTLRTAEANVAQYTRQVAQDMDSLVLLVGAPLPDTLVNEMTATDGFDAHAVFRTLPVGLPAELLERRPDIRAAEHTLIGANANIGAARAAFFPQIALTANGGTASNGLRHLFGAGQGSWLFEPTITVPIFDAGRNLANLDIAKIETRIEVAHYERAIQSAFRDVADALAARSTYGSQVTAEQGLVDADLRYYRLADMRFRNGVDTYLNVLVAENSLLSARLTLISLKLAQAQSSITLYNALGGGWQEHTDQAAAVSGAPR
jgi:multidrug efflux system outer membrane protein